MGKLDDVTKLDATAQAELVRRKEVTPLELAEAAIARIEKINPKINAVVTPMYDEAVASAKGKLPDGPFTGVPFLVKDLIVECAGVRQGEGMNFTRDFKAPADTELARRYRKAGLVIIGKTNTPELGILPTTEPKRFGAAKNPWNVSKTTGGSSGGSAAAVASRMVPMAHGNDGGGSIRIPSSCCGLFGLKPTRGRNSLAPNFGDVMDGLVCEHALTISVRDSAALLDATSGPATGDPYYAPPPSRPFASEAGAPPGKLRIGFTATAATGASVHDDCAAAVNETATLCEKLGHHVEVASFEVDGNAITQAFLTIWFSGMAWEIAAWSKRLGREPSRDELEPLTWALIEAGRKYSSVDYMLAVQQIQIASRSIMSLFEKYDVILTPTLAQPPLDLGSFDGTPDNPMIAFVVAAGFAPFTPICNMTGQPAMSVPLHWNRDGLPIGSHFMGRYGDEATLIRLAAQLERERPWADKRPPVSA